MLPCLVRVFVIQLTSQHQAEAEKEEKGEEKAEEAEVVHASRIVLQVART